MPAVPAAKIGVGEILSEVARMHAAGRGVIPLHTGEPDFPTPKHIVAAGVAAFKSGQTHYTPPGGLPELRRAVADEMRRTRGLDINPDQVIVTPGAKMAIHVVMQALCQPGDEVICVDPSYGAYAALAELTHATVRRIQIDPERGLEVSLEQLERNVTSKTRLIVLNSPGNPTGHMLNVQEVDAIAQIVKAHPRVMVMSDEIYSRIVYGVPFTSPASHALLTGRTVIVDGFSKAYAMTGWRVGYAVVPPSLAPAVGQVALDTFLCVNGPAQVGSIEALRGPQDPTLEMVATFRRRRDGMIDAINSIPGLRAERPAGAFYAWVDARELGIASSELSLHLLRSGGIATYPGTAFGPSGDGFVRLTFATSEENITRGVAAIAASLRDIYPVRSSQ